VYALKNDTYFEYPKRIAAVSIKEKGIDFEGTANSFLMENN